MLKSLVFALATRRLTHLIVEDKITETARNRVLDNTSNYWINYLLTCTKCMSIWAAIAVLLLGRQSFGRAILNTLALSEASILVDETLGAMQPPSLMN
ncbi:hypothetical protein SEA_FORZA_76 [Gordonia phage Forza]|uniref:DUF1360 domain-containing protein n=1 Tax=Gordonia phage Forza TaxID=2571247 RepID=A0A650EZ15_9CAUD|nr:hypothetical protein PP303_gp076 [Gordonia phage Forza]QEM41545.1 hypothetical protein SEA_BOOPY_76 [Gordonia phage Boopy]QGT55069.1 hypothetical protein SEA_FORZA_76 [Gordonia phage Forza]UXE04219.1 hypothetical protein SEA_BLUENGOLD_75 [Gordonia phage BlueNGold]WBF03858.1 hypothetical protein SEA_MAREELIH_75 [Gordonia phage Mareelih]